MSSVNSGLEQACQLSGALQEEIQKYIFGQQKLIELIFAGFWSDGHVLMTGVPGVAKTLLAKTIAAHTSLDFGRVQFTPDVLPSDITGAEILQGDRDREFVFRKGPIFTNILLADEINRATPRTQSALLEAMQERRVTAGTKTYTLDNPFMVLATQNPLENEGTFPLPEAQLDRFLLHCNVDYPDADSERKVLEAHAGNTLAGEDFAKAAARFSGKITSEQLRSAKDAVKAIKVDPAVVSLIQMIVSATRPKDSLFPKSFLKKTSFGSGPRGGIALISAGRAVAMMEGVPALRWNHIERILVPTLRHRVGFQSYGNEAEVEEKFFSEIIANVRKQTSAQVWG